MKKEISCINTRAILDYVGESYDGDISGLLEDLHPELDALPDPEGFLRDPNNWTSCGVARRLYERAARLLADDLAAYKIARYAVRNVNLGYAQSIIVKTFWSSRTALKHAQKINDKWNRNKRVEVVHIGRNEGTVRLHWNKEMDLSKDFCLMNQGTYTFLPLIWGGDPLTFKETRCFFEGEPYCEYHLKWPAGNRLHEIFSRFFTSRSVLMEIIKEMEQDKGVIAQKYEEVNRLNVQLNRRIRQLVAIQETGKAILSVLDQGRLLTVIMNILSNVCSINRALVMLVNEDAAVLEYLHSVGFEGEVPDAVRNYKVPLDRLSNILARVASTGRSEYIPEVNASALRRENIILTYGEPKSVHVVPLITRSKVIGVFATDAVDQNGVPLETRETLEVFAPQIAIAIENARLYRRLQEQMDELKRSHALLSRAEKFSFLGNLSARLAHEIKNPMTAIGTFIQMLPQKYEDEEFRTSFYQVAMEETNRVNRLITELLDLVKTREPYFQLDELPTLIEKMILLVSPKSKEKRIEVTHSFDPDIGKVWMDSEKMKQVILNLVLNAVEFTPEGGKIEFATRRCHEKGREGYIRIEIKDSGIGVPPENRDKIFDPYFTTKHKSTMHSGTGLGLFIAHQNIQDHKGTIDVKSTVGKGTVFTMTFPENPTESPPHKIEVPDHDDRTGESL